MPLRPAEEPKKPIEKRPESQEGPSQAPITSMAPNFLDEETTADEENRKNVLHAIEGPDISTESVERVFDCELGKYTFDIQNEIRSGKNIDLNHIESEMNTLNEMATPQARARAEGIIKILKFEKDLENRSVSGEALTSEEIEYRELQHSLDTTRDFLKNSVRTLQLLTQNITARPRRTILRIIGDKTIVDGEMMDRLKTLQIDPWYDQVVSTIDQVLQDEASYENQKQELLNKILMTRE